MYIIQKMTYSDIFHSNSIATSNNINPHIETMTKPKIWAVNVHVPIRMINFYIPFFLAPLSPHLHQHVNKSSIYSCKNGDNLDITAVSMYIIRTNIYITSRRRAQNQYPAIFVAYIEKSSSILLNN